MAYSFVPIAIQLDALKKVRGSKDAALLKAIIASSEIPDDDNDPDEFEMDDDDDEDEIEELEALTTSQEALSHIIMGDEYAKGIGSKYGYMLKEICLHLGERLPDDNWGRTRAEFVEAFDGVLKKLGIPASTLRLEKHFWSRPDPIDLAKRMDFPSIGHLTLEECKTVLAALSALTPDAIDKAAAGMKIRRGEIEPGFVKDCLKEIEGWCRTCVETGRDLVVFYH